MFWVYSALSILIPIVTDSKKSKGFLPLNLILEFDIKNYKLINMQKPAKIQTLALSRN